MFYKKSVTGELFFGEEIDVADAVAIQINGLPISVGGTFDTGTAGGANGFIAAAQAALAAAGYVYTVAGGWDGTGLIINVFTTSAVTSVVIVSATGADVALTVSTETLYNVYSASTASTGATLTNLDWVLDSSSFDGAPTAQVLGEGLVFGTYSNFYTTSSNTGAAQLIITDSVDCNDTFNGTN